MTITSDDSKPETVSKKRAFGTWACFDDTRNTNGSGRAYVSSNKSVRGKEAMLLCQVLLFAGGLTTTLFAICAASPLREDDPFSGC